MNRSIQLVVVVYRRMAMTRLMSVLNVVGRGLSQIRSSLKIEVEKLKVSLIYPILHSRSPSINKCHAIALVFSIFNGSSRNRFS